MRPTFHEAVAGLAFIVALSAVVFAAVARGSGEAMTALVAAVGAGFGWYYRGKVQPPGSGNGGTT